jgi:ribosomal protein L11 methyltransferase
MTTHTALTTVRGAKAAEALAEALERLDPAPTGVGFSEIEDGSGLWEVGAYFEAPPEDTALALLAAAHAARPFAVSELPETDWVAKVRRQLAPVEAGRFFLYGTHDAGQVPEDRVALLIEASMAFGTGHHGTTKGCLLALERLLAEGPPPARVADVGAGTAVLAMAAAKTGSVHVVAGDIDPVAVEVAAANLTANGLSGRIACVEAAGFGHPAFDGVTPADLVFANILKGPLIDLADAMAARVAPGGHVILSGLLIDQGAEVAEVYARCGFNPVHREDIGDWTCLTLRRMPPNGG